MTDRTGGQFLARDFEKADRNRLLAMYSGFEPKRAAQGLPPQGDAKIERWLDRVLPRGRHIVVEVGGRVCGHVMLMPMDETSTELANFLHQSIRGRGIGTAMNALALRVARESGFKRVWLSVEPANRAAVRSYEKVGFRRLPGSYWAPEIEMTVELDQDLKPAG
ncbi:MAG TPA: GNAT family N-acetyltransferase [Longimicrobiales bacterium]|nr:GNAT family N-acetyltransferase [Longimicrobiales bacterium]